MIPIVSTNNLLSENKVNKIKHSYEMLFKHHDHQKYTKLCQHHVHKALTTQQNNSLPHSIYNSNQDSKVFLLSCYSHIMVS